MTQPASSQRLRPRLGRVAALSALGAVVTACTPDLPQPVLNGVAPGWGFNGEDTMVDLVGAGFYPRVQVDARERAELDLDFTARLETSPPADLLDVAIIDYQHISATVPAGLDVGTYAVTLVSPTGAEATLTEGFEVRDSRADQLLVSTEGDQFEWQVYDYAALTVELVDPAGERVPEDLVIEVKVGEDDADSVLFQEATLDDQEPLEDGLGIRGRLGPDGLGVIALTSTRLDESMVVRIDVADDDASVSGAVQFLSFVAGEPTQIQVGLPSTVFDAVAGESFGVDLQVVDELGVPVEDAQAELAILEGCSGGTYRETVNFVGELSDHPVTLTRATGDGCAQNRVEVFGFVNGVEVSGQSAGFAVSAAEPVGLTIDVWPTSVTAGQDPVYADVRVVDEYRNRVGNETGGVAMQVTVDGSSPFAPADQDCEDIQEGQAYCIVRLDTAGEQVVLLGATTGPESLSGASEPFTVLAGTAVELTASVSGEPVAGEPFELRVRALDDLGNGVLLDPEGADSVLVADGIGDVGCAWSHEDLPRGTLVFACSATVAAEDRSLLVSIPSRSISVETPLFDVINGELAIVSFDLGGTTQVEAGDAVVASLRGTDAWGNPYLVQDDPVVELMDLSGPVSPSTVTLGPDGRASVAVTVTVARSDDQLLAEQDGWSLGSSATFRVVPGPASSLQLTGDRTYAWLDQPFDVQLEALDDYGNRATDYTGPVTLSSVGTLGDAQVIDDFDDGLALTSFVFHSTGLVDALVADDGDLTDILPLDILDPDCSDPPVADLQVAGEETATLCLIASLGRTSVTSVSAAGSTEGAGPILAYHYGNGEGSWTRSTLSSRSATWSEAGAWRLDVTVADRNACGSTAEALVYVAPNDGSPAGPVEVDVDASSLGTRTAATGLPEETDVWLEAWDCTGDPASTDALLVRVDLGEVLVDGSIVTRTGSGLEAQVDSSGTSSLIWSAEDWPYDGLATLHVGHRTGQAYGTAQVDIEGDLTLLRVQEVDPHGTVSSPIDEISITFAEPLFESSVEAEAVVLIGPRGVEQALVDDDLLLSADGRTVTLLLPETLDPTVGIISLELLEERTAGFRDEEGNFIDGGWTGVRAPFLLELGAVSNSAPNVSTCTFATSTFRPDGDDGAGSEADDLRVNLTAASTPAWWWMQVRDQDGAAVRTTWVPDGSATTRVLTWDGRGDHGRVLDDGAYQVEVGAADVYWNLGATCSGSVTIDNRGGEP